MIAARAQADSLVPAKGQAGYDAALEQKDDYYGRVLHTIMTPSLGWGLEADIGDPASRRLVDDFVKSGSRDFQAQSVKHAYQIVDDYNEFGDLGMFGGVQAAGDAFRCAVLLDKLQEPSDAGSGCIDVSRAAHQGRGRKPRGLEDGVRAR